MACAWGTTHKTSTTSRRMCSNVHRYGSHDNTWESTAMDSARQRYDVGPGQMLHCFQGFPRLRHFKLAGSRQPHISMVFSNETVEISEDKTNIYKCPETGICSPVASQAIVIQCLVLSLVSALFAHVKQHSAESQNADTDTHTHIYICMYTYIHIYTDICIYTHTSTIKETHK